MRCSAELTGARGALRDATPTPGRRSSSCAGEGARLWDAEGNEYLDFFAGLSVHNAGHCHPRIVAAIARAGGDAGRLLEPLLLASRRCGSAERLAESSLGGTRLPLQLGRRGERVRDQAGPQARPRATVIERPEIVTLDGAFHGRTLGALAATPKLARDDLFGPAAAGLRRRCARRPRRPCARRSASAPRR